VQTCALPICFEALFKRLGVGRFASICGRYFAMDRDQRWDRVAQAWQVVVHGQAPFQADTAAAGLAAAYAREESDEFVKPTRIGEPAPITNGDSVFFMNFRADRARELSHAFLEDRKSVVQVTSE